MNRNPLTKIFKVMHNIDHHKHLDKADDYE